MSLDTVRSLCMLLLALLSLCAAPAQAKRSFTIKNDAFIKDGKPHQVLSGSLHYYRVHPAYWHDRLYKMRAGGLNTVETYIPWNYHERLPGQYSFSGETNVTEFILIAQSVGLDVIVRPGPYICSEWDYGALPWWLTRKDINRDGSLVVRSSNALFMYYVKAWFHVLLNKLKGLLYHKGGPIIMMQVENEMSFWVDHVHSQDMFNYQMQLMALIQDIVGEELVLFTVNPSTLVLRGGALNNSKVLSALDICNHVSQSHVWEEVNNKLNPPGRRVIFCPEFYTGFHPRWGQTMHQVSLEALIQQAKDVMGNRGGTGSINFYMYSGGSSRMWAGCCNQGDPGYPFYPIASSYDSGYPMSEAGDYGQPGTGGPNKYKAIRELIMNMTGATPPLPPSPPTYGSYPPVHLPHSADLLSLVDEGAFGSCIASHKPMPAEEYGVRVGVLLYRTYVPGHVLDGRYLVLNSSVVSDMAQVYLKGSYLGHFNHSMRGDKIIQLPTQQESGSTFVLDIVVQVMGRMYFYARGFDPKGILMEDIQLGGYPLTDWCVYPIVGDGSPPTLSWATSPRDSSPKDASPRDSFSEDASPKDSFSEDASPRDSSPKDASPKDSNSSVVQPSSWKTTGKAAVLQPEAGKHHDGRPEAPLKPKAREGAIAVVPLKSKPGNEAGTAALDALRLEHAAAEYTIRSVKNGDFIMDADANVSTDDAAYWRAVRMGDIRVEGSGLGGAQLPGWTLWSDTRGVPLQHGPRFFRGFLTIPHGSARPNSGQLSDSYLNLRGWSRGIAWVNQYNLGWYWPQVGPQHALYVPGAILVEGDNEILLLEIDAVPRNQSVVFGNTVDWGYVEGPPPRSQNE